MLVTVKFEVLDMHPDLEHICQCVHEETQKYEIENPAIIPEAHKRYCELFKRFNGPKATFLSRKTRYEVRFYTI